MLLHAEGLAGSARVALHSSKHLNSDVLEKYVKVLKLHNISFALVMESCWLHGTDSMVSKGEHAFPRKEAGDRIDLYRLRVPPPKAQGFWQMFHTGASLNDWYTQS
jgi:hypothetical protein